MFMANAPIFVYSLLKVLSLPTILRQPLVASRALLSLSTVLRLAANHWSIAQMMQDAFNALQGLTTLVKFSQLHDESEQDVAATMIANDSLKKAQSQFKVGLALCFSVNTKWLTGEQREMARHWLTE